TAVGHRALPSFPTRRSSDLRARALGLQRVDHDLGQMKRHGFVGFAVEGPDRLLRERFGDLSRGLRVNLLRPIALRIEVLPSARQDRKSTRLNSSHGSSSYDV